MMRLFSKAILLTLREKKKFTVFCLMYTTLIFFISYSLEGSLQDMSAGLSPSFWISLLIGVILVLLYGWIIISKNKRIFATFKCIGYANSDINKLVFGQILFTTVMGLIIVIEFLFHYSAVMVYLAVINPAIVTTPLISLNSVIITFSLFLVFQLLGYFILSGKIKNVRPIIALRKVEV